MIKDKCEGCPRLEAITNLEIPNFKTVIEQVTGQDVACMSYTPGRRYPDSVNLRNGQVLESFKDGDIGIARSQHEGYVVSRESKCAELTDGCPGMLDANTVVDGQLLEFRICGKTAIEGAANPVDD